MELSILSRFGLNKNDIKVYEALLHLGRSKTGAIITRAHISSSSTYASLSVLVRHGLVSYQVRNNVKYYQAEIPHRLIEDTKAQTNALEKLSKEIVSLPISHEERNEINVYQGVQGFKRAHEIMANELKKGEEVRVIAYSTHFGKSKVIRNFFHSLDKRILTQTKARIRMIVDRELMERIMSDRPAFIKRYDFRCLPSQYFNPCGFDMTDSMVVMGVSGKNPIAFTIRNRAIIESFRANFDLLWSIAKK